MDMLERMNYSDATSIKKSIDKMAAQLTSEYLLQVNDSYFLLTDIEFYIQTCDEIHHDPYAHADNEQLEFGKIYLHGSGFDVTIGDKELKIFGGILCRGAFELIKVDNAFKLSKYIDGPLNLQKAVFSKIHYLIEGKENKLQLIKNESGILVSEYLIAVPRIGLHQDRSKEYFSKHYRFVRLYSKKENPSFTPKEQERIMREGVLISGNKLTDEEQLKLFNYVVNANKKK